MEITDSIVIHAVPERVWRVTIDVEKWPSWNRNIQSVRRLDAGPFDLGSKALIKQRAMAPAEWTVTEISHGESFTWTTVKPGLQMSGSHLVRRTDEGTSSRLGVSIRGPLGLLLLPLMFLPVRWAIAEENRSLRTVCESER